MRKIKVKICNFNQKNPFSYGHFFLNILKKYYDVELSENPDYLIYDDSTYEYLNYDCVKIFYTGENLHPDFNFCDYAITFDYMDFEDRHYRLPIYLMNVFYSQKEIDLAGDTDFTKPYVFTKKDLGQKTGFCSFVYSNYLADQTRKIFFDKLSKYKKVDGGGKYLNNVGGPVANKVEFEMKHKFSMAFENSSRSGYTTEKIINSLAAKTIPIYWGNPKVYKELNEKRFINCNNYKNFDEVIERVKEIDNNDDLYLSIINEPVTIPEYNFKEVRDNLHAFLRHIIDQPLSEAKRVKINYARKIALEKNERLISKYNIFNGKMKAFFAKLYQPIKKLGFLESLKRKYFQKTLLNK